MFVLRVSARARRSNRDPASSLLAHLRVRQAGGQGGSLRWDRTFGGGLAGLTSDPDAVIGAARIIVAIRSWNLGIGAGAVAAPAPAALAELDGDAVTFAQDALARAGRRRTRAPVAVTGADRIAAADAEALLTILAHQWESRSEAGWQAVSAMQGEHSAKVGQQQAARTLGISQQALSQRLRAAGWAEEEGILPLLRRRLIAAEGLESPQPAP